MLFRRRKIVLVGTGMVGMSFAFAALNQNVCDELTLIDIDRKRAEGEAMDLNHGLAFSGANMKITAGGYEDCADADLVVLCAGVNQKPGESRLELLQRNAKVFESIVQPVVHSGFEGIFLVATNPVDIMTRITFELSGFNAKRVLGTGTALDTARLRYLLGEYLSVDPRSIHAFVMGEHGDSEFVPWSQALLSTKPIREVCSDSDGKYDWAYIQSLSEQVRGAAQQIIEAKRATYYGIGMTLTRIARSILFNENSVLTLSARLMGEYGQRGVYAGVPCIVNRHGVDRILELSLPDEEMQQLHQSCSILEESFSSLNSEAGKAI